MSVSAPMLACNSHERRLLQRERVQSELLASMRPTAAENSGA
jgi:hypothetical protein